MKKKKRRKRRGKGKGWLATRIERAVTRNRHTNSFFSYFLINIQMRIRTEWNGWQILGKAGRQVG